MIDFVNMKAKEIKNHKGIVYVGLSGGVDSSVSAALLKKAGFDVHGVFIKVWQPNIEITGGCTWKEDRLDAMRVCAKLDIPFHTLDLEKKYKKEVVDYMINEYKAGRTPNPDVMCNKYIKFGGFFDWAMKKGTDYVATGHYARTRVKSYKVHNVKSKKKTWTKKLYKLDEPYELLTGVDTNKDQSYFLWTLTQKQLSKTLFPIGDLEKTEVRKLARKFGLETATKKDSQGLCFIGKVDMADFLKNFIKTKTGKVLNENDKIIGTHNGAQLYTIGQRHGFTLTKNSPSDQKKFVVKKDIKDNTITISDRKIINEKTNQEIGLININWILDNSIDEKKTYKARIRYRGELNKCKILLLGNDKCKIIFQNEPMAPASGQSVVIYDACPPYGREENCLGGGIIE